MTNRLHLLRQPYRDIAERWVKALRSGEYQSCAGWLKWGGKYCGLGVLQGPVLGCEIAHRKASLSDSAMELSGIAGCLGDLATHKYVSLAGMNDTGTTFPEIADLIESVPVGLWRDECFEAGKQPTEEEGHSDG